MFRQQLPFKAEQAELDRRSTEIHPQNTSIRQLLAQQFTNRFSHQSKPHEQLQLALPGALAVDRSRQAQVRVELVRQSALRWDVVAIGSSQYGEVEAFSDGDTHVGHQGELRRDLTGNALPFILNNAIDVGRIEGELQPLIE